MTAEFTGERVVPGQVDIDLWNEHVARYAFASRLCRNRRVVDLGCGTGYGSAELAATAQHVIAVDSARDALDFGSSRFPRSNLSWLEASAASLPFAAESCDLVIAFEVIEHMCDWQSLIQEARRVLAPGGQFVVSTPNKLFYAQTRGESGPNPYHEHEFEYEEFCGALLSVFTSVSMFVEDHTEAVLFRAIPACVDADVRLESTDNPPVESNFFIAVCAMTPQTTAPAFLYVPSSANLLKEKLEHINRLQNELKMKDEWLRIAQTDHQKLLEQHRDQTAALEKSNAWAQECDLKLKAAGSRIVQLQDEVATQQKAAQEMADAYEARLSEITKWAQDTETRLTKETAELGRAVQLLDRAEATVEERTRWALELKQEREALELELAKVRASRWVRLGRTFGIGPEIHKA